MRSCYRSWAGNSESEGWCGDDGTPASRSDLAAMVASTREPVNAAVIGLREKGILEIEGGRIVLLDPERLTEIGGR